MELSDYFGIARRRWWMVVAAGLLCALASGGWSFTQAKAYTAETRLLVPAGSQTSEARTEAALSAQAYAQLAGTPPAVDAALGLAGVHGASVQVEAFADGTTPFLDISVTGPEPVSVAQVANSYAQALPRVVLQLEAASSARQPTFTVLQPAFTPTGPSAPNITRNVLIGLTLGLIAGLAMGLLREALDGRLRSGTGLEEAADAVMLGMVPREFGSLKVPARTRPRSRRAEAYRSVRTNLEFFSDGGMPASLAITSASSGEGKTSLAANLAVVVSRAGRTVVVIDGDLRKPSLANYFNVSSTIGLTDVLKGRRDLEESLQPVEGDRLWVLPAGPRPAAPGELVGSTLMTDLIEELESKFDLVIIDTPPLLPVSDGLTLAANVDAVLLVARMRQTTRRQLMRAAEEIRKVKAELIGVVGNAASSGDLASSYGYGYGGYGDSYVSRAKAGRRAEDEVLSEVAEIRAAGRRARLEERPATPRRSPRPVRDFRPYAQDSDSLPPRSPRGAESTEVAPAGTEEVSLQRRRLLPAAYQPHDLGTATGESQSPADGESLAEFPGSRSAAADPELDLRTRQSEWDLDPEVGVHVVGASQADVWPQDHNVRWR